jgi:predicted secreted protein
MDGSITFGGNTPINIRGWDLDYSAEMIESTVMGNAWRSFVGGLSTWKATVRFFLDYGDTTGQKAMIDKLVATTPPLTVAACSFLISATKHFDGSAFVQSIAIKSQLGNLVEYEAQLMGNGAPSAVTWS